MTQGETGATSATRATNANGQDGGRIAQAERGSDGERGTTVTVAPHRPWLRGVSLAARLILAVVWIYAAATKITQPAASANAVRAYEIFPWDVAAVIGKALPVVELAIGVLLLIGLFVRWSAIASALLLIAFIAGISSAWARGLRLDCGCFGGDGSLAANQDPQYLQEILRDSFFLLCAAWLAWRPHTPLALDRMLSRTHRDA